MIRYGGKKLIFLGIYNDIFNDSIFDNIDTHCSLIRYIYKLNDFEEKNIKTDGQHENYKYSDIDDNDLHQMVKMRINDLKVKNYLL